MGFGLFISIGLTGIQMFAWDSTFSETPYHSQIAFAHGSFAQFRKSSPRGHVGAFLVAFLSFLHKVNFVAILLQ